jgi:hypothetical protein
LVKKKQFSIALWINEKLLDSQARGNTSGSVAEFVDEDSEKLQE